ncbi:hypothetical protein TanjilG_19633 [Lupinus angustifolius]|uniref:Peptidase A1 domain-containing protein n=1 Tax=Lupinus angustifolius TaxID=3871 RepID=A0A1J7I987_LUPAN|nr:PREDICTED: probable aspartyl protease At4g16563 [Lupinus angustifolius]OIW11377.1 hypothetical protein TanjilG_19633 [Lupinus angustifolius]
MEHRTSFPMTYPNIILCFLCLFSFISSSSSSSNPNTITLPLSPLFTNHPSSPPDPFQSLKLAASASLTRATHLKHSNKTNLNDPSNVTTEVHSKSYGGYSIDLQFGTPTQTSSFVLDTGSSLVWFPCSSRYTCSSCSFSNIDPTTIPKFIPKNSTSSKIVGCANPKCGWIFGSNVESRCNGCNPKTQNCSFNCPTYIIQYGLGSTAGLLLSENLNFPAKVVPDFLVGCSLLSIRQPSGIAGFGRGLESLPSQMGLKRFSYCLVSHKFDDSPENSDLVLQIGSSGDGKTSGLSYTPFQKNPEVNSVFKEYYYVSLKKIMVGGKRVKIPIGLLEPGSDGNGGTIVDSGSTFTFMERQVFELVAQEFEKQIGNNTRAKDVETQSGLSPCFTVDNSGGNVDLPQLTFGFRGGAKMVLPVANYFSFVDSDKVVCLTIVSDGVVGPARGSGPAIILGNYQQQNFNVEFDLENERFGFGPRTCNKST